MWAQQLVDRRALRDVALSPRARSPFGPLWLVARFALCDSTFARRSLVLIALCWSG